MKDLLDELNREFHIYPCDLRRRVVLNFPPDDQEEPGSVVAELAGGPGGVCVALVVASDKGGYYITGRVPLGQTHVTAFRSNEVSVPPALRI